MGHMASPTARPRMGRPRALLLVSLALALAGAFTAVAVATTGPGYLLNPPKYRIRLGVLRAYTGRYASSSVASGSGIVSSELYIGVAESGYAAGGVSIYSYDSRGMLQAFAGTVYNFRLVGNQVEADIVSTDGTTVLGHVLVRHAGSSRNLVGTLEPPTGGRFAIAYRYAASEGPLPGQAYAPVPLPSGSGVRSGSAKKPRRLSVSTGVGLTGELPRSLPAHGRQSRLAVRSGGRDLQRCARVSRAAPRCRADADRWRAHAVHAHGQEDAAARAQRDPQRGVAYGHLRRVSHAPEVRGADADRDDKRWLVLGPVNRHPEGDRLCRFGSDGECQRSGDPCSQHTARALFPQP
jgi:hypothetical protein